ncbi:MAG: VWA domain-containing protein [Sandaracinaceae bacterium]|nr:VWA domain-containing protein [Sandaracinaceae bacterium]
MSRAYALGLRAVALAVIALAPWAPSIALEDEALAIVFVVDRSASLETRDHALADAFVREAEAASPGARVGVVEVDGDVRVRRWPFPRARGVERAPALGTDLAAGIRLAAAIVPASGRRRVVVLSDGRATTEGAEDAARDARARGIRVDVVALGGAALDAPRLAGLDAYEERVAPGEPFRARVTVVGPPGARARVALARDGDALAPIEVVLDAHGRGALDAHDPHPPPGPHVYEARLGARFARVFAEVAPEPRVLVMTLQETTAPALLAAALDGSAAITVRPLTHGPPSREELRAADLVVLTDLPIEQPGLAAQGVGGLDEETQRRLLDYVSEDGGGLLVTGGVFGLGPEWAGQPIARLLPLAIEDQGELHDPPVALAMMLDTSGSMGVRVGAYTKIRLAAEGCLASAAALRPEDRIAIGAVEERTRWVWELGPAGELDAARVRSLRAGSGGIFVYTALRDAYRVLDAAPEPIRHVLLFSDTEDSEEQAVGCIWPPCVTQGQTAIELATLARARGVTTTVVGIGSAVARHAPFLAELAAAGGGRYYVTETGVDLSRIFVAETRAVARSNLRAEPTPVTRTEHPILEGIGPVPPLAGLVMARPRSTAHEVLSSADGRPVLSTWRYGVGTVVAFTSDLGGRWSGPWATWEDGPRLLRQAIRAATRRRSARAELRPRLSARAIELEVELAPGTELGDGELELVALDGAARRVLPARLERVGPSRLRARAQTAGEPLVVARLRDADGELLAEASAHDASFDEHAGAGVDERALRRLARAGEGALVAAPDELAALEPPRRAREEPLWPWLFLLGALLVTADLLVRRVRPPARRVALAGLAAAPHGEPPAPPLEVQEAA